MILNRSYTVICLQVALLALTSSPALAENEQTSLKAAFENDFLIGVAINRDQIMGKDSAAQALIAQQFNSVTAENVMKWEKIHPQEGRFDWVAADQLVKSAESKQMHVAGHVLVWHQQTPDWVFQDENGGPASRSTLLKRMEHHIKTVVGRYRGKVASWEVVNEVFNEDGSFRQSPWHTIIGEDFIEQAFTFAQQADPDAYLYFNDYNLFKPAKRAGAVTLAKALLDKGLKLDGVGLQAHYGLDQPQDLQQVSDSIAAIAALGIDALITEMDVAVLPFPDEAQWGADISLSLELQERYNPWPEALPEDIAMQQAQRYAELFGIFLQHREHISRVTFWGLTDRHSWKNGWPIKGRTEYPLLFDRNYQPKAAYQHVIGLTR